MSSNESISWAPEPGNSLGASVRRVEDEQLVQGKGKYLADLIVADTLHAHFVRSPIAHGVLVSISSEDALELAGVHGIFTADNLQTRDLPPPHGMARVDVSRPALANGRVRYVGEPIAMVVAESAAIAADAAELVWPEIEELDLAMERDPQLAHNGPPLFEGSNVLSHDIIESERRVTDQLPVGISIELHNQRVAAVAIEGLGVLCEPMEGDRLRVTCGHQAPHRLKGQLAATLGMEPDAVQVVVPHVGGAFGLKGMYFTEYAAVAAAARDLRRPVVWVEGRREHLTAGMHGRDQIHRVTLDGDSNGRIRRARIEIIADVGAYPQGGAVIPTLSRFVATGLYDIEDVTVEMSIVVSNRAPTGSYRGAGRPEAAYAIERAVDSFAEAAGLDPAEVRRINMIRPDQLPYKTATGAVYDSGDYVAALDMALHLVDVDRVRAEQNRRLSSGGNPIGLGISAFIERTGGATGTGEFGDVEVDRDGRLIVRTGSTDSGQGHRTVWSQTVSEIFDVEVGAVDVIAGDTDEVADGVGTYASRSAQVGASAVYRMAVAVREKARKLAAEMLEASQHDIEVRSGHFHVAGVPESGISLADIGRYAAERDISLRSEEMFVPETQAFPYGVHVAVVEVELETGVVTVERLVTVDDCGNVLNPMIVAGQLHGSLIQGIGQALLEGIVYAENGSPLTGTLVDYLIPTAAGVPPMTSARMTTPAHNNPLGVKGTGEAGCIGAPPAIVNAAIDALRPFGVTDLQMPLTPARVWDALKRGGN